MRHSCPLSNRLCRQNVSPACECFVYPFLLASFSPDMSRMSWYCSKYVGFAVAGPHPTYGTDGIRVGRVAIVFTTNDYFCTFMHALHETHGGVNTNNIPFISSHNDFFVAHLLRQRALGARGRF